jgi:hypothetical protein
MTQEFADFLKPLIDPKANACHTIIFFLPTAESYNVNKKTSQ